MGIAVDIRHPRQTMATCSRCLIRSFGPSGTPPMAYRRKSAASILNVCLLGCSSAAAALSTAISTTRCAWHCGIDPRVGGLTSASEPQLEVWGPQCSTLRPYVPVKRACRVLVAQHPLPILLSHFVGDGSREWIEADVVAGPTWSLDSCTLSAATGAASASP